MKKLFLVAVFAVLSLTASAQNKNDGTYEYFINVYVEWGGSVSKKPYIPVVSIDDSKVDYIYDTDGDKLKFASRSALINYFTKLGWIFVQDMKEGTTENILFKKMLSNEKEAKNGIVFKDDLKK